MNPQTSGPSSRSPAPIRPTISGGTPSMFSPVSDSTMTMPRRITDWETQFASRAPRKVPGEPPRISGISTAHSTPLTSTWLIAAESTSGTAWTRSVPTRRTADSVG